MQVCKPAVVTEPRKNFGIQNLDKGLRAFCFLFLMQSAMTIAECVILFKTQHPIISATAGAEEPSRATSITIFMWSYPRMRGGTGLRVLAKHVVQFDLYGSIRFA
jgi:hypothetical protein